MSHHFNGIEVLALAAFLAATPARAQTRCRVSSEASPSLGDAAPEARVSFLRLALEDQSSRARTWSLGWAVAGLALAGGSFGLAAIDEPNKRAGWIVSGAPALWYPLIALVDRPGVIADHAEFEALLQLTSSPVATFDRCILVARGEELLFHAAADERTRVNWFAHSLGIAASVGIGIFVATALHDVQGGVLSGVGGVAVSELNLWSAPTGANEALTRYRAGMPAPAPHALGFVRSFVW